ncbi:MAG: PAS domain-containing sensor histidine kinase, partial [Desulfuromonadales bacterium]
AARNNQPFHSEYRFCTPDGQITWVVGDARAIHQEDGSIAGYIGTITDIHRAKLDRIALKQHTERIRTIIEQMPVLLFAFDEQGCLSAWNAEAERVTGYSAQDMIGNPQAMEWLCPDPGYRRQMHDNYRRLGDDYLNWEWHLTAKDGTTRIVAFSNIAGRHPIDGWANWGVGVDVTSFRRTEQALGERVKELTCLYKLSMLSSQHNLNLEDFLGEAVELLPPSWQYPEITCARIVYQDKIFATDDFTSTPWKLSSQLHVRGLQVGLIEVYYREEKPELAEGPFLMEERLLCELEKFTHSVSHDLRTPLTAIGFYAQILEKQIQKNNLAEAKNSAEKIQKITVRMEHRLSELLKLAKIGKIIEPSEKIDLGALISDVLEMFENRLQAEDISVRVDSDFPWVIGDRIRLMEVFENLLENAIKYHSEDIFQIFWRLDKSSPGDGTGLAITKRIIEAHGGRIWVESEGPGQGARFCFTLGHVLEA